MSLNILDRRVPSPIAT